MRNRVSECFPRQRHVKITNLSELSSFLFSSDTSKESHRNHTPEDIVGVISIVLGESAQELRALIEGDPLWTSNEVVSFKNKEVL